MQRLKSFALISTGVLFVENITKYANGSLIFKIDSQRSLWNWFLLSCPFDFHEVMFVLQTNLKEKIELECGEEYVRHRRVASKGSPVWLFNIIPSELIGKATQRWARCDSCSVRNGRVFWKVTFERARSSAKSNQSQTTSKQQQKILSLKKRPKL